MAKAVGISKDFFVPQWCFELSDMGLRQGEGHGLLCRVSQFTGTSTIIYSADRAQSLSLTRIVQETGAKDNHECLFGNGGHKIAQDTLRGQQWLSNRG